jgi:hypothetical protein
MTSVLGAAIIEGGLLTHKVQLQTCTVSKQTTLSRASYISIPKNHFPLIPTNHYTNYSTLSQPAYTLTALHSTLKDASLQVQSSRPKDMLLSSPKNKYIYQHSRCHRPQNYTFPKLLGSLHFFRTHCTPHSLFWGLRHIPNNYSHISNIFFDDILRVVQRA